MHKDKKKEIIGRRCHTDFTKQSYLDERKYWNSYYSNILLSSSHYQMICSANMVLGGVWG